MDGVRVRIDGELGGLELVEAVHARPHFARHSHATYALGIMVHSTHPGDIMYRGVSGKVSSPSPRDVATLRALYY